MLFLKFSSQIYKAPNVSSCEHTEGARADQKEFLEFRKAAD